MKYGKALKPLSGIILALLILCGCTNLLGENYSEASEAKKLYSQLNSGHFYMRDNQSGEITQEFTFMYDNEDTLHYFYMAKDGEDVYYEFHNGSEMNYKHKNDKEWTGVTYGSDDFYVYTKEKKHPYTDQGVIAVNAYAVTEAKVEKREEGKKVDFKYDASKLSDAFSDASEMGELKSFESTLWLNNKGYCYRLDQKGVFEKEGKEETSDFSLFIDKMNEIEEIERPQV